jgi:hypothetical protein
LFYLSLEKSSKNTSNFWKLAVSNYWKTCLDKIQENPKVVNKGYTSPFHKLENYVNPTLSIKERNNTLREIKNKTLIERTELRKVIDHENPKSSKEKLDSLVFQRMFNTIRDEFKKSTHVNQDKDNHNILKELNDYDEKFAEGIIDKIKLYQTMQDKHYKSDKSIGRFQETKKVEEEKSNEQRKVELALKEIEEKEKMKFENSSFIARVNGDPLVTGKLPQDYFKNNPDIEKKIIEDIHSQKSIKNKNKTFSGASPKRTINFMKSEPGFSADKWMKTDYHHPGVYVYYI